MAAHNDDLEIIMLGTGPSCLAAQSCCWRRRTRARADRPSPPPTPTLSPARSLASSLPSLPARLSHHRHVRPAAQRLVPDGPPVREPGHALPDLPVDARPGRLEERAEEHVGRRQRDQARWVQVVRPSHPERSPLPCCPLFDPTASPRSSLRTILIDCGKSFLSSALEFFPRNGLRQLDAVLLTHPHADGQFP